MSTKKVAKVIVFGVLPLVVLGVVGFVTGIGPYDLPSQSRKLEAVMAESKRLGLPMTATELVGEIPPPETNAAPGVLAALPVEFDKDSFPSTRPTVTDFSLMGRDERLKVESEIAQFTELLTKVESEVKQKPNWYVARDYDLGPNLMFHEYAKLKYVSTLFAIRSRLRAVNGDSSGAISDFTSARKLSNLVAQEPNLIGTLVAIALDAIALRTYEELVVFYREDLGVLTELETALIGTQARIDCRQALRAEFYSALTSLRNLKQYGGAKAFISLTSSEDNLPQLDPEKILRDGLPKGMVARASMTTYAECWNEVFQQLNTEPSPARGFGKVIDKASSEWNREMRASRILPSIFMPVFSQVDQSLLRNDCMGECAFAFVRAFAFHSKNGRWPKDLTEMGLNIEDPFMPGESVKFVFSDNDVRVWSIGPNKIDEDGVWGHVGLDGSRLKERADDWGLLWPRPKSSS